MAETKTQIQTVTMHLAKSTTGTHVYQEDLTLPRDRKLFPTVYVQRSKLPDPPPKEIEVTIRF